MTARNLFIMILAGACVLTLASASQAVSEAGVLFLRIAPGARAAGMGEAFVAIANDATATHWNPAGLGTYPLAESWSEIVVPSHLRPLKGIAALHEDGGAEYQDYDIWAITPQGLARYDRRRWHLGEVFGTKSDQTIKGIVKSYFGIDDEERLTAMAERVANANNAAGIEALQSLRDSVLNFVPESFTERAALQGALDSLLTGYLSCLVNWEVVAEARKLLLEGLRDSSLTETEMDRIMIAVERARNRFIPEEITIPYATLCGTDLTAVASTDEELVVGAGDGLYTFNGKRWRILSGTEAMPSTRIRCLTAVQNEVYVGTDSGLMKLSHNLVAPVEGIEQLPRGPVTAVGWGGKDDIWVAVNNDLYHWDGQAWSNSFAYTVAIEDTPDKIAQKFALFGAPSEHDKYVARFLEMNPGLQGAGPRSATERPATDSLPFPVSSPALADSAAQTNSVEVDPDAVMSVDSQSPVVLPDSVSAPTSVDQQAEPTATSMLTPGMVVRAPYVGEIRGEIHAIHVLFRKVWVGTEFGVLVFDNDRWSLPGYRTLTVTEGQTLASIVETAYQLDSAAAEELVKRVALVNDLADAQPTPGRSIRIPRNPAAARVNAISGRVGRVYFATSQGVIQYEANGWSYVDQYDLDESDAVFVDDRDNGLWIASDERVVVKADGRGEIALMFAKWLPELADDLYYGFASFTSNAGTWGTFGGNLTYISYGSIARTDRDTTVVGELNPFEIAFTASYGTSLSSRLKGGVSAKMIYSHLADVGAGTEKGKGTATGFGIDLGLLYLMSPRLSLGMAITNIGPKVSYIDATQADALPRNLSLGFAYKLVQSDYFTLLVAGETNKMMVSLGDGFSGELKQITLNGGAEFLYANTFALRGGYIHDEEGKLKTMTFGVGFYLKNTLKFDFGYYFGSQINESRKGIKPLTFSLII
ncbi:MAG TPA: PorV/PorQ family protein [Candidatus Deferrimicrobium sp.]|nr:PorV/PorQ family protein [Candidatus Deferrimicrobium sp.]